MAVPENTPTPTAGRLASEICKRVVQLLAEHTGRGPMRVRAYMNDDLVTVLLQDLLTKSEKTLVDDDKEEPVLEGRRALQDTMKDDLIAVVEEFTGRKVIAFISANHLEPDVEIESFLLAPEGAPAAEADGT